VRDSPGASHANSCPSAEPLGEAPSLAEGSGPHSRAAAVRKTATSLSCSCDDWVLEFPVGVGFTPLPESDRLCQQQPSSTPAPKSWTHVPAFQKCFNPGLWAGMTLHPLQLRYDWAADTTQSHPPLVP
jgi:hypothetical protein